MASVCCLPFWGCTEGLKSFVVFCFVYGFYFFLPFVSLLEDIWLPTCLLFPHSFLIIAFVLNFDNHVFEIHWF